MWSTQENQAVSGEYKLGQIGAVAGPGQKSQSQDPRTRGTACYMVQTTHAYRTHTVTVRAYSLQLHKISYTHGVNLPSTTLPAS